VPSSERIAAFVVGLVSRKAIWAAVVSKLGAGIPGEKKILDGMKGRFFIPFMARRDSLCKTSTSFVKRLCSAITEIIVLDALSNRASSPNESNTSRQRIGIRFIRRYDHLFFFGYPFHFHPRSE